VNTLLARILLIGGVCLAAVGGAGFDEPVEALAWPLFLGGVAATLVGGLFLRRERHRRAAQGAEEGSGPEGLAVALANLAERVARLDDERESLEREELCRRLDELFDGPYFEIGSRSEHHARLLGAAAYASIWEGFAVSERLLSRAWSMAIDGHLEEALEELPRARRRIAQAAERASGTPPPTA